LLPIIPLADITDDLSSDVSAEKKRQIRLSKDVENAPENEQHEVIKRRFEHSLGFLFLVLFEILARSEYKQHEEALLQGGRVRNSSFRFNASHVCQSVPSLSWQMILLHAVKADAMSEGVSRTRVSSLSKFEIRPLQVNSAVAAVWDCGASTLPEMK
jgi:hypothetical protein